MTGEPARGRGYPGTTVAAAALATVVAPVLSLIAALFLLGRERDDTKRRGLRTWAWASGGWIGVQVLAAVVIALVVWNGSSAAKTDTAGPCVGGPKLDADGRTRPDGKTVFPCEISGTATVDLGK